MTKKIYVNARFLCMPLTGVQRYAIEISFQLKKINSDIQFICPHNIIHKEIAKSLEARVVGYFTGHVWEQTELAFFMASKKNAILWNPCNAAPILSRNIAFTLHDFAYYVCPYNYTKLYRCFYSFITPIILRKATHIFVPSATIQKELSLRFPYLYYKSHIAYNGLASHFLANKNMKNGKEKIILVVASLSMRKNISMVINAYLQSASFEEYKLIVIGSNIDIYKQDDVTKNANIEFYESISDQELSHWYIRAQFFVSMSSYEGFGLTVLEALYYNCIVICSDIEVYKELYAQHVYYCEIDNDKLLQLFNNLSSIQLMKFDMNALIQKYNYERSAQYIYTLLNTK